MKFNSAWKILFFVSISLSIYLLFSCSRYVSCKRQFDGQQNYFCKYIYNQIIKSQSQKHIKKASDSKQLNSNNEQQIQEQSLQPAKIAYFITASTGENAKTINLLQKIMDAQNIYVLHLDKKMNRTETYSLKNSLEPLNSTSQNIFLLPQYYTSYLGIAYVDIELTAMAFALSISMHWTHYINLSPSDYPLLTQKQIQILLAQLPQNISFIEAHLTDCYTIKRRIFNMRYDQAVAGFGNNELSYVNFRIKNPQGVKILKGGQWKIFSREMAKYFAYSEDGWARRQLIFFANTKVPMEHYFQTAICNSPVVSDLVRIAQLTYKNWDHIDWKERAVIGKLGPNYMNLNLLMNALDQGTLFARKFGFDAGSETAKKFIENLHEGQMLLYQNLTFTQDTVFENAKNYYFKALESDTCKQILTKYRPC